MAVFSGGQVTGVGQGGGEASLALQWCGGVLCVEVEV